MSNYTPIVAYGPKDALSPGDPNKVILGTQQDAELQAISAAIATKYDSSSGVPLLSSDNTWTGSNTFSDPVIGDGGIIAIGTPISGTTPGIAAYSGITGTGSPFVAYYGLNVGWNGSEWVTGTDGGSNGAVLFATNHGVGTANIIPLPSTGGTNQVFSSLPTGGLSFGLTNIAFTGPSAAALVDMTPDKSSFTGTFTGFSGGSPTATVLWSRQGNQVTLLFTGGQGTSNSTSFTMTGLPSSIQPSSSKVIFAPPIAFFSGGANCAGLTSPGVSLAFSGSSGTILFQLGPSATGWSSSSTKGIVSNFEVSYSLL